MAITVLCPKSGCSASSVVPDSFSGRKVRCKKCSTPFVVQPTFDGQKGDTQKSHPSANANPFPVLPAEFGRYRVLKLLGRGGMGAVYLAEDTQLGRQVALKIPFFDSKESPQRIERFVREARSAAVLSHPNICRVFDSGQIDGRHFITMEFIEGAPLETEIGRGPMAEPRAAEIAFQVAEALSYANGKGTVHRDLKPANIMIAEDGEAIVMDFGLAKQLVDADPNEAKLSRDGGLLGTPSYMSPEQVKGDVAAIGPATDIYSLGVVLFEMLTGTTPYTGAMGAVMGQILGAPVPPLSEFYAEADPRLEMICRKAMAKNPADRFPSMAKFANALGKYLQEPGSAPVQAPKPTPAIAPIPTPFAAPIYQAPAPISAPQRVPTPQPAPTPVKAFDDLHDEEEPEPTPKKTPRKTKRRRPVYLGLAVALAVLLPLGIWLSVTLLRVETPNGTLVVEIDDPEVEAKIKDGKLILSGPDGKTRYTIAPGERDKKIDAGQYKVRVEGVDGLVLDTPEFTLKKGNMVTVRVTMEKKAGPKKDPPKLEGLGDENAPVQELEALRRDAIPPAALALAGGGDPERAPSQLVGVLGVAEPIQTEGIPGLAYSPDGRWLASASMDKTVFIRDAATLRVTRVLKGHTAGVRAVAFSKDSKTLASAGLDGTVRLWTLDKDEEPKMLAPDIGEIHAMVASPDGRFLAVGGADKPIKLWTWGDWDKTKDLAAHQGKATSLSFSPDGDTLASSWEGSVRLYRTADGKVLQTWAPDGSNRFVAFHRDGKRLVTTGGHIKTWDVAAGKQLAQCPNEATEYNLLALHPDGESVYGCNGGGLLGHMLELTTLKGIPGTKGFREPNGIWSAVYGPSGRFLAFGTDNGGVHVWDFTKAAKQLPKQAHSHYIRTLSVGSGGRTVLSGGDDNAVRQWDVVRPGESKLMDKADYNLHHVAYSADGKKFVTSASFWDDTGNMGIVWQAATGKRLFTVNPTIKSHNVVFSPDGKSLAGCGQRGGVDECLVLWDANSGLQSHKFPKLGVCLDRPAFSRDGKLIAAATIDTKCVKVWDVKSGEEVASWTDEKPMCAVALSPDGGLLAAGHQDGSISLWEIAEKGKKQRVWEGHTGNITRLMFTSTGATLVSSGSDGTIRIWGQDQARAQEVIRLGPPNKPLIFDLDRSGKYLFAAGQTPLIFILRLPEVAATKNVSIDPDRKAAEYVLSVGGIVRVNGEAADIRAVGDLPKEPFILTFVHMEEAGQKVTDAGLVAFKGCVNLKFLQLRSNAVGDSGLAHFKDCKDLTNLQLYHSKVTNQGLSIFANCKGLTELILNDCGSVGDAGLTRFKDCNDLIKLEFPGTLVTDAGLANFKNKPKMIEVRVEGLQGVTDLGLSYFLGCDELKSVHLGGTKTTTQGIQNLRKKFPNLDVR